MTMTHTHNPASHWDSNSSEDESEAITKLVVITLETRLFHCFVIISQTKTTKVTETWKLQQTWVTHCWVCRPASFVTLLHCYHTTDLCTVRVNCLNSALLFVQSSWTEAVERAVSSASEEETVVDASLSLCVCVGCLYLKQYPVCHFEVFSLFV